ncbi:Peptidase C14 [Ceratobasidium theobromae]|uniref:Peptidase C14 n=1 Tax=Ceratobasidium theobromae TaxID=1582974 RepID=A0A5N5Q865_9AGAM|nr:Peptidase C14 [Ceratobasidium theobromae]
MQLNSNLDMWKIVDNLATDNRLKDLFPSHSARYDSSKAAELKRGPCTEGTHVDVLAQMHEWTHNLGVGCVCWMNGMAGTGKTTIAYSLCSQLYEERKLAASFFCSRLLPECRDVNLIIPSITYQLARFSRPFRWALSQAIEEEPDACTSLPQSQFKTLITKPLLEVQSTLPPNMVIVIDALDECNNKDSTQQILDVLLSNVPDLPVKFFVSSRPKPEIRDRMMSPAKQIDSRIVLHELDEGQVQLDIGTYLRAALEPMNPSPSEAEIATAVRYISYNDFCRNTHTRLQTVLSASSSGKTNKDKEIDELYTTVLQAALDDPGLDETEREDMKLMLHTVICAQEPLTTRVISGLLRIGNSS